MTVKWLPVQSSSILAAVVGCCWGRLGCDCLLGRYGPPSPAADMQEWALGKQEFVWKQIGHPCAVSRHPAAVSDCGPVDFAVKTLSELQTESCLAAERELCLQGVSLAYIS